MDVKYFFKYSRRQNLRKECMHFYLVQDITDPYTTATYVINLFNCCIQESSKEGTDKNKCKYIK